MGELRGIMTAIATPFDAAGDLSLDALPAFLDFQRAAGIDGVVVAGTNGEGVSLSVEERKRLLEAVLRLRGRLTVIAATGASSMTDAVELTRHAGEVGADAVLILPPFFFKGVPARGIAAYFHRVMDASVLPALLYSIPQVSGVEVTDEILALTSDHPRFAGLKDSAGVWERTGALLARYPHWAVFPGADDLLGRALTAGARGAISGTANAFPELVTAVRRAHEQGGDVEAAQARLSAAIQVLKEFPPYAGNKAVLAHRGLPRMHVRPPLLDLAEAQVGELIARLKDAGALS